jgi:hypothetical protein
VYYSDFIIRHYVYCFYLCNKGVKYYISIKKRKTKDHSWFVQGTVGGNLLSALFPLKTMIFEICHVMMGTILLLQFLPEGCFLEVCSHSCVLLREGGATLEGWVTIRCKDLQVEILCNIMPSSALVSQLTCPLSLCCYLDG